MPDITLTLDESFIGQRLDQAISRHPDMLSYSRADVQSWIKDGHVTVYPTGEALTKASLKPSASMTVVIHIPQTPSPMDLDAPKGWHVPILFEDEHLIVIDKPTGLSAHPGAGTGNLTLVHVLRGQGVTLAPSDDPERPGIVHRLDKHTTGVMIVAKTTDALSKLQSMIKKREVSRHYTAIIWGNLSPRDGTIDAPLGRDPKNRLKRCVLDKTDGGKRAVTHYNVTAPLGFHHNLVTCKLETGRTHQIRVHMAHMGHPVVGDSTYAPRLVPWRKHLAPEIRTVVEAFPRQALHAQELQFSHPITGDAITITAPLPQDMAELCTVLRNS